MELTPDRFVGDVTRVEAEPPLEDGTWYTADTTDGELRFEFPPGALTEPAYVCFELLLAGAHLAKWELSLREGRDGRECRIQYGALNECEARVQIPLTATNQNQWGYDRKGAWLKPLVSGDRVDLETVDRLAIRVVRKSEAPVRWCQTPVRVADEPPPPIDSPTLPEGPLVDRFGQSTIHEWDEKTNSEDELVGRLEEQASGAGDHSLPGTVSEWGGWTDRTLDATGYFRTEHDGDRWWLVDPDGHPFWSAGLDCVRPRVEAVYDGISDALTWIPNEDGEFVAARGETYGKPLVDYLAANLIRAFGEDWHERWTEITFDQLRRLGFNTVGNWSEWRLAHEAGYPYVRPLSLEFPAVDSIYRDFPDVFADDFTDAARSFAEPLAETREDPAMIGYFMGNEPEWGFADETPAAGMLYTTESSATRSELRSFLEDRYEGDDLGDAWGMAVSLADVESSQWREPLTDAARSDLRDFSEVMVDEFYRTLSEACREVDPNHLNLGTRYAYLPGDWALRGMTHVDVFSINCYRERVPDEEYARISELLDAPVLVGEWHFGALDVGLPASGIGRVRDQQARGRAYRTYLEDAAAKPWCVGTHYFTLYDHSVVGRFDGENYNIGFFDVCNRPYEPLAAAARRSHERLYNVASGRADPYDDPPEYLPKVF